MERICKNCRLYNDGICAVTVIVGSDHYELPVRPDDACHWERVDREIQTELRGEIAKQQMPYFRQKLVSELETPVEIKQIRAWSDGKNGYIEMPEPII